jgi:hypothetical protein
MYTCINIVFAHDLPDQLSIAGVSGIERYIRFNRRPMSAGQIIQNNNSVTAPAE